MSQVREGQNVSVHYVGTFDDGTVFDSSRERDEPLAFVVGSGQVIPGFDAALHEMTEGETKKVSIAPEAAYGEYLSEGIQDVPLTLFPEDTELSEGLTVYGQAQNGQPMMAKVHALGNENVTLDFNHPMAGKTLNFEIELLTVEQ